MMKEDRLRAIESEAKAGSSATWGWHDHSKNKETILELAQELKATRKGLARALATILSVSRTTSMTLEQFLQATIDTELRGATEGSNESR